MFGIFMTAVTAYGGRGDDHPGCKDHPLFARQQNPELKLHVVGHTDNVGDLAYNTI